MELLLCEVNAEQGPHAAQQLPPGPVPDRLEDHQVLLDAVDGKALDLWGDTAGSAPSPATTEPLGKDQAGALGWRGMSWWRSSAPQGSAAWQLMAAHGAGQSGYPPKEQPVLLKEVIWMLWAVSQQHRACALVGTGYPRPAGWIPSTS